MSEATRRDSANGKRHAGERVDRDESVNPAPIIGVFDSGLGGLTVAREIMHRMPGASLLYLADMAHVPYGPRPASDIRRFARGILDALLERGATAVVAACNMSSALALPVVESEYDVPLIGMIRPGVSAALAAWEDGPIGVLATEGTCASLAYPERVQELRPNLNVIQSSCPDFVPLVESGETDGEAARDAATRYLRPLLSAGCRTIILGCTHYPWLLPVLRDAAGPGIRFVDPAQAAVDALRDQTGHQDAPASAPPRFAATALPERLETGVRRWLNLETEAELWPIWEPAAVNQREFA